MPFRRTAMIFASLTLLFAIGNISAQEASSPTNSKSPLTYSLISSNLSSYLGVDGSAKQAANYYQFMDVFTSKNEFNWKMKNGDTMISSYSATDSAKRAAVIYSQDGNINGAALVHYNSCVNPKDVSDVGVFPCDDVLHPTLTIFLRSSQTGGDQVLVRRFVHWAKRVAKTTADKRLPGSAPKLTIKISEVSN